MFKEINFPLPGEFLRLLMRGEANVKKKKKKMKGRMTMDLIFTHSCGDCQSRFIASLLQLESRLLTVYV